jgi:hypothetical protein
LPAAGLIEAASKAGPGVCARQFRQAKMASEGITMGTADLIKDMTVVSARYYGVASAMVHNNPRILQFSVGVLSA